MSTSFRITYLLTLSPGERVSEKIRELQLEQSAELPDFVVESAGVSYVKGEVSGRQALSPGMEIVSIDWPVTNVGHDPIQFLNVLFGNISMKTGICIMDVDWTGSLSSVFKGPSLGIDGIRSLWDIHGRALSCTALKPMGAHASTLASLAYQFAIGRIDIIKDDHGLVNQPSAPFKNRVLACVEAIDKAAQKTGFRSRYFPNITAKPSTARERYETAAELGADGVLIAPMLTGPGLLHELAQSSISLPIIAHPSFSGTMAVHHPLVNHAKAMLISHHTTPSAEYRHNVPDDDLCRLLHGVEPGLLYGGITRALGADFVIYPNSGGRFSFPEKSCVSINNSCRNRFMPCAQSFPTPGGGLQHADMPTWLEQYGIDTAFLIGGSLYADPEGIEKASLGFTRLLSRPTDSI